MGCSWISRHELHDAFHASWFVMHDIGFIAFIVTAVSQVMTAVCGGWWVHRRTGILSQYLVFPVLIVSGTVLCSGVRPREDWVVFASYGASWSLLCAQMVSRRIIRRLHGASVLHNMWTLWYLWCRWGSRNRDLFVILSIVPWIHLNWMSVIRSTDRIMHIATGIDIIYMGLLGTVFSFTHEPYLDRDIWTLFVLMHIGYLVARTKSSWVWNLSREAQSE